MKIENNCDTLAFNKLSTEDYLIESNSCQLKNSPSALYFTSRKEFSEYYSTLDLQVFGTCLSTFNNFNFKKYNMILINLDYDVSTTKSITTDIKFKDNYYSVMIKQLLNKDVVSALMPGYFNKCISLPKEKSINKPKICLLINN